MDYTGIPTPQLDVAAMAKKDDLIVGSQDGISKNFKVSDIRGINDNKASEDTTYSSKQINKIISDLSSLSNEDLTVVVNAIGDLTTLLNSKADTEHTHTISQITDMPTSMKNPESLKLKVNGTIQAEYNGEESKELNITPGNIGAAESNHTHRENIYFVSGIKDESNNYNVTLDNITDYYEGLTLCLKVDVNSVGESTLKINELDSIPLLDSEGNPLEADTLKAGIPYHVCYCGTNFIVLGKGGDKGIDTSDATATSEDLLINKSAYGPNGKIEGAMPNNSGINKVLALNETYNIPKGYQDGSSKVTQNIANNGALNGSIGVNGTFNIPAGYTSGGKVTQSIPVLNPNYGDQLEISEITVGAFSYGVANNYAYMKMPNKDAYLNGVQWIFHYEPYLLAQNIAQGANIFGIAGSAAILRENSGSFSCNGRTTYTVTLGYRPKAVYLSCYHNSSNSSEIAVIDGKGTFSKTSGNLGISVTITNDGFQYYATSGSTLSPTWYSVG